MTAIDRRGFLRRTGLGLAAAALGSGVVDDGLAQEQPSLGDWAAVRGLFNLAPDLLHFGGLLLASHPAPVRDAIDAHRRGFDANPVEYLHANQARFEADVLRAAGAYLGVAPAVAITPRTRVLATTWVQSSTGVKLPIRAMADAVAQANAGRDAADRVLLCVDGVHRLGVEDLALAAMGCDFFVAGCHKWLFGPRGTGLAGLSAQGVVDALRGRDVIATVTPYATSYARLAPGLLNSPEEVDAVLAAISALVE